MSRILGPVFRAGLRAVSSTWEDYSRLIMVGDGSSWVLSWEAREVSRLARKLGVPVTNARWVTGSKKQAVFYGDQYGLLLQPFPEGGHRIAMAYFHGKPYTGERVFDECYARLRRDHQRIDRIQSSHTEMRDIILESGVDPRKVFLIPIGINLSYFSVQTPDSRSQARAQFGIPQSAVVVGSFQKDGVGWGEGSQPKLIKGPDVFLKAIEVLRDHIPEIYVLLSGPARGFVTAGLERLRVPYKHLYLRSYPEVGQLFQALDVYIVASRQEGGPKALLESMASGVPLVTTRVGQAMDIVKHEVNGWMVDVEEHEALAHWAVQAVTNTGTTQAVLEEGLSTARQHSYDAQLPLWKEFMHGFVTFQERIGERAAP
jgi:glycosyltransferase involved in cell wall biosynthesis